MRKVMKQTTVVLMCAVLAIGLMACGSKSSDSKKEEKKTEKKAEKDFDAAKYVKGVLDASYKLEFEEYAEMTDSTEEEAKQEEQEKFDEVMEEELAESQDAPDADKEAYKSIRREIDKLAKYEVGEAKKDGDNFVVTITLEPADIFEKASQIAEEKATVKAEEGIDPTTPDVLMALGNEALQEAVANNTYKEAVTLEVAVTLDGLMYEISDEDLEEIDGILFPGLGD